MKVLVFLFLNALAISQLFSQDPLPTWKHFAIDPVLPGSSWGTGSPALADYDGDGDLDVAISRRNTLSAYWYERINDSLWIQHLMGSGETFGNTLGTTPIDVDHDGWMDGKRQSACLEAQGPDGKGGDLVQQWWLLPSFHTTCYPTG